MSSYYDDLGGAVVEQMAKDGFGKKTVVNHFLLEKALTEGVRLEDGRMQYTLMVGNRTLDISSSVVKSKIKIAGYLDRIVTGMGSSSFDMINSIILAGGGGAFLKQELLERLGNNHELIELNQGQFAIAQGYAALGVVSASKRLGVVA